MITRHGGPEVLEVREIAVPQPGPGQVLIKVAFAGVNYVDLLARRGGPYSRGLPSVPGYEVSGTVSGLGEGVTGLRIGEPVAALTTQGGYAEYALARATLTFPLAGQARAVGLEQGAAFPAVGITAYDLLVRAGRVASGERILIHAASGGVGTAAGQIARALGAGLVLGVAGSEAKAAYAAQFGYDRVVPTEGFEEAVREATAGEGVDIALDASGEPTRSRSLALLARFGRLVVFGNASGNPERAIPPGELLRSNRSLVGYSITALTESAPQLVAESARRVLALMGEGKLTLPISEILPLEQAVEAHRRIEARAHLGKLLLRVG